MSGRAGANCTTLTRVPSPLASYLRVGAPSPNPPKARGLPAPKILVDHRGGMSWDRTLLALSGPVSRTAAMEMAQGLGRLLAAAARSVEAPPDFDPIVGALEHGDRDNCAFAVEVLAPGLDGAFRWAYGRGRAVGGGSNPGEPGRFPGLNLIEGAREAAAAAVARHRSRDHEAYAAVANALIALFSVLADGRPELSAEEVLAVGHGLLDFSARQAAAGGLWVETSRRGSAVRADYGRGPRGLISAHYDLRSFNVRGHPPVLDHVVTRLAAHPGARPSEVDWRAAIADVVRMGARRAQLKRAWGDPPDKDAAAHAALPTRGRVGPR